MRIKQVLSLTVIAALLLVTLPPQGSAHAISVSAVRFGATCGDFSLMVAITGTNDDGGGFDRFRYLILDGNGKKLYQEDAVRQVGVTIGSQVINMSYDNDGVDGPPTANPIRLQIIDLDANGNPTALLKDETFNASCLPPAAAPVTITENFRPAPFLKAFFIGETQLFRAPGRDPMDLRIVPGKEHFAFYRSPDSQWIAIDVSGQQLMWVPVSVVSVDIGRLGVPPRRIDGSDPATAAALPQPTIAPSTGFPLLGQPFGTALVTTRLRLRSEPSLRAPLITTIPRNETVIVYARNTAGTFIRVQYRDLVGWVSTCCVSLIDTRLDLLPRLE
jgi:hypothetical protein